VILKCEFNVIILLDLSCYLFHRHHRWPYAVMVTEPNPVGNSTNQNPDPTA